MLPTVVVAHPVDGRPVDTYFYAPPHGDYTHLHAFGRRNPESAGALLAGFFQFMGGSELDYAEHVVSVRTSALLPKLSKAETDCWPTHARLSVEDPFETW